jgi:hypothetical protein
MLLKEGQMSDHKGARQIARRLAESESHDRRPRLGQQLVPCGAEKAWNRALHPFDQQAGRRRCLMTRRSIERATKSKTFRQTQGLAANRNTLRPLRPHLLLRDLNRSRRRGARNRPPRSGYAIQGTRSHYFPLMYRDRRFSLLVRRGAYQIYSL